MNEFQRLTEEFHRLVGIPIGTSPGFRMTELRAELIREEASEFQAACVHGDFVSAIDALCDTLYVTFGSAVSFGIDIEPFFREIHRSNMTKSGKHQRDDGKILKGPDYEPPNLEHILERMRHYP